MVENNIIIKITSEADVTTADVALEELIEQSDKVGEQIDEARKQFRKAMGDIEKAVKDGTLSMEDMDKEVQELTRDYVKQRQELAKQKKENDKSIKSLKQAINTYNAVEGASGKMVQRLRAMREALQDMEDAGEYGSQAFIELSIAASKLQDQLGDTQEMIRVLSSDTIALDTAMSVGQGVAGGFYIATSAAEIFGDELEGLQKAFYKVQAAMAIISGVQQIYDSMLKKQSIPALRLNRAAQIIKSKAEERSAVLQTRLTAATAAGVAADGAKTISTRILTKAQLALNKAVAAFPFTIVLGAALVVIGAVVAAFFALSKRFDETTERTRAMNNELQRSNRLLNQLKKDTEFEISILEAEGKSELEIMQLRKRANDERVRLAEQAYDAMQKQYFEAKKHNDEMKQAMDEATQNLKDAYDEREELANESTISLIKAQTDAAKQLEEARIDLMKDGASKEIAQINLNYKQQLKAIEGHSASEIELRKVLLAKQAKEIAKVRRQYALQAQQTAIQEQKNLLTLMSQSRGTEADYAEEIALTKKIAEAEAQARIDALDKETMAESEYKAQVEAIRLDLANTLRDIDEQEVNRLAENKRRETEIVLAEAEAQKNALTGAESQDEQLAALNRYYAARKKQLEENAEMERQAVQRSTDTEEVKEAKIKQINANLQADLTALNKEGAEERINIETQYLGDLEREVSKTEDAVSRAQIGGKLGALQAHLDAQLNLYQAQQDKLEQQYAAGLITYQDYKQQEFEIAKAITDAEVQYQQDKMQAIADGFEQALGYMQQVSDFAFESIGNNIQAQIDKLDEMYTTDWQEAQNSANKKYITEKEYEKKKAALEMKQAKYAKAQALINAGISTALAIVTTIAQLGATPWGIAASVIAGAMGAAQMAIIASKPLAQYEKGRKGGKGEYAIVGEKGAEIMYVPQGASIIPHNKIADQAAWADYGVPKLSIPPLPTTDLETTKYISNTIDNRLTIDYDKLGEAVARNMPKPQAVTVNVDRSGVQVNDGFGSHTYLNRKYAGSWN